LLKEKSNKKVRVGQRFGQATFFATSDQGLFSKCIRAKLSDTSLHPRTKENAKKILCMTIAAPGFTPLELRELQIAAEQKA
jgi:hypothetical protein